MTTELKRYRLADDPEEIAEMVMHPSGEYVRFIDVQAMTPVDPAAIREAALREAAEVAEALAIKWWAEYKDRLSPHCADPQYQGMSDGADDVATAIEALIGEKK